MLSRVMISLCLFLPALACGPQVEVVLEQPDDVLVVGFWQDNTYPQGPIPEAVQRRVLDEMQEIGWRTLWLEYPIYGDLFDDRRSTEQRLLYLAENLRLGDEPYILLIEVAIDELPEQSGDIDQMRVKSRVSLFGIEVQRRHQLDDARNVVVDVIGTPYSQAVRQYQSVLIQQIRSISLLEIEAQNREKEEAESGEDDAPSVNLPAVNS